MSWAVYPFALFYSVQLIRALPFPLAWKKRKPLSCDVCLAFWASFVVFLPVAADKSNPWWMRLLYMGAFSGLTQLLLATKRFLSGDELIGSPLESTPIKFRPWPDNGDGP